jgi:ADP-heptose:LPS heptosyltransferase
LKTKIKSLAKKIFDKKNKSDKILETDKIKSILFFRDDDKIGDMTVSTLLFREIKKKYCDVKIIVLCGKNNREIIKYNNNVDEIYEVGGSFFQDILIFKKLAKPRINLAVDFYQFMPRFKHLLMLRLIAPEFLIGFYKQSYNIYDFSIDVDFFDVHISKKYEYLLKILKIENPDLKYDIVFTSKEEKKAFSAVKNGCRRKYRLVLNPFAASRHRSFDYCKLKELISLIENNLDCCVFVLCNAKNTKKIKSLANDRTFIVCFKSVLETAALIKQADVVITPDTSIVHISAAFNKKTIALYLDYSNTYEKINLIWGPNNPNAVQLSVNTKNNIVKNDIKSISSDLVVKKLKEFLG